jgi:1,4-alpha-glucan branching enzyme
LFEYYKKLIALRKQNPGLQSDNIEFFHENPETKVLAYVRWNEGARVVVVANFSDQFLGGYKVANFPAAGTWHEWMGDYDVEAGENEIAIDLPEYEARVLIL